MEETMPANKIHSNPFELQSHGILDKAQLPIDEYRDWYDAIVSDDAEGCEKILAGHQIKQLLLNGQFRFESINTWTTKDPEKSKPFQPTFPLTVAACYQSSKVFRFLLKQEIDLFVKEEKGLNVIHSIIQAAHEGIEEEDDLAIIYNILAAETKIGDLLREENEDGLRPLEMAACLGLVTFFHLMFDTPIYKVRELHQGHIVYKWYDVTEYESFDKGNRRDRSPVVFFRHMVVDDLGKLGDENSPSWMVIRQWINNKVFANLPLVILWFLLRIIFILVCFTLDAAFPDLLTVTTNATANGNTGTAKNNTTANTTTTLLVPCQSFYTTNIRGGSLNVMQTTVATLAMFSVLFDIIEYVVTRFSSKIDIVISKSRLRTGAHGSVVHTTYFRIFHFLFCSGFAVCTFIQLYYKSFNISISWSIFFLFSSWSLLYFVQLLPSIGYLVVILERLIADTIHVMLIFVIFFLPFVHVFLKLHMRNNLCDIIRMDNMGYAIYDVFIVMLNMIAFKEGKSTNINMEIYGTHVIYVILISTIVMNLIIALYSDTVTQLAPQRSVIMQLQKLSVMLIMEKRLAWLLHWYYRRIQKYCYVVENDRLYLLDVHHSKRKLHDAGSISLMTE